MASASEDDPMLGSISQQEGPEEASKENPLRFESNRLISFTKWPSHAKVEAGKIAKAGFYYLGNYLEVRCVWCNCTISSWEYGDQVMGRHRRAQPECPFVLGISDNVPLSSSPRPPVSPSNQTSTTQRPLSPSLPSTSQNSSPQVSSQPNVTDNIQNNESPRSRSFNPEISTQSSETSVISNPDEATIPSFESPNRTEASLLSEYHLEERRLRTFVNWPLAFIQPDECSASGFIYTGFDDNVRCVFCLGYVGAWEETDQPSQVHAELFPSCPFVVEGDTALGNVPMTSDQRQQVLDEIRLGSSRTEMNPNPNSSIPLSVDVSQPEADINDINFTDVISGVDETGFRSARGRDLNSGPERGQGVLTIKVPSTAAASGVVTGDISEMMGVIKHSGPAQSKYATVETRLRSFREWPPALKQQPQELADAGFYYIGLSDQVKCFYCDGGLRNWQPEDDPWVEHARWFSKCSFIRLVKGDEFISQCLASKPPEDLPELPVSMHERFKMAENHLRDLMTSIEVQEALSCGIDPSRIRMAFQKKWEETGSGFTGSQHLIEALHRFEAEQAASSSATLSSSSLPVDPSAANSAAETVQPTCLNVPSSSPASQQLSSPNCPDQGLQPQPDLERVSSPTPSINVSPPSLPAPSTTVAASSASAATADATSPLSTVDLESENRRLKEERTCKICMDHEIGVVFLPCGHLICCNQCAPALTNCPLCRQQISGTVKTYLS